MQEGKIDVHDNFSVVFHNALSCIRESPYDCYLNPTARKKIGERFEIFRRHCKRHSLLRLRDPDFPRCHSGILEGDPVKYYMTPITFLCHLRNRTRQTAGAVIGNTPVEAKIPGLLNDHV